MLFIILLTSIIAGLCLGIMHSFLLQLQIKRIYSNIANQNSVLLSEKELKKQKIKNIFSFASFYLLSHLLLLLLLAFLIIKLEINILVTIFSLMFSFWAYTLKSIK